MSEFDLALRVAIGTLCGVLIGAERARDHKATGMRTLALVGLGAALLVAAVDFASGGNIDAQSRVVQGLITGVGFLGAGVILHGATVNEQVHGLTSAAAVWVTAILGITAGIGQIWAALAGGFFVVAVLLLGGRVDQAVARRFGRSDDGSPPR